MSDAIVAQVLITLASALGEAVARGVTEVLAKSRPELLTEPLPTLPALDRARAEAVARLKKPNG